MRFRSLFLCLILLYSVHAPKAQTIHDLVGKYTNDNGKGYLQPLADVFGANMNSGLFQSAKIKKNGFQLYLGVVTTTALIADDQRSFTASTEDFSPATTAETPTIFGDRAGSSVTGTGGTVYNFPGGLDLDILPLAIPQLTVGSIAGTDFTVRYIIVDVGDDFGKLTHQGYGIRHSISQYFDQLPVDLAMAYYYQAFEVEEVTDAKASLISLQGSITTGVLTAYGGIGYEMSTFDIAYTHLTEDEIVEIAFDLDGKNAMRFTAGLAVDVTVFRLHAEFNVGSQSVFALGCGFAFGNSTK